MACFEAARICPRGVLCKPHYDEYRRLSQEMFRVLEQYSPMLVPASIDEGFLDFTTMERTVWRHTTAKNYVEEIRRRIADEIKLPVSAGLASSARLAKLATDAGKPGFIEVLPGEEKEGISQFRPGGNQPDSDLSDNAQFCDSLASKKRQLLGIQ